MTGPSKLEEGKWYHLEAWVKPSWTIVVSDNTADLLDDIVDYCVFDGFAITETEPPLG